MSSQSRRVYSTEINSCKRCGLSLKVCRCEEKQQVPASKNAGRIIVARETKGRKGSGVTLIKGLPLQEHELKELAKAFKQLCGSGGAVKQGVIEIQGEHRDKLLAELIRRGYQAVKSGA
jgi:translation initiation factor 1